MSALVPANKVDAVRALGAEVRIVGRSQDDAQEEADRLDDVVLLTEEGIAEGIRHAFTAEGEMVEGAGAVGIAALLAGKVAVKGPTIGLVSGRNIDEALHRTIVNAGHAALSAGGAR